MAEEDGAGRQAPERPNTSPSGQRPSTQSDAQPTRPAVEPPPTQAGPSPSPPQPPSRLTLPRPYTHHKPRPLPPPSRPPPPPSVPTTSIDPGTGFQENETFFQSFAKALYNPATGAIFWRTPKSWGQILLYIAMYLIFLVTFTLTCLYISLVIIKDTVDFNQFENLNLELLTYPEHGVGLTATPTSEGKVPLIWYKHGEKDDYKTYIQAIDKFLSSNRRKREVSSLGPCGESPYGYGEKPCVIVRINKQFNWAGKPLHFNSSIAKLAPAEVQAWMKADGTKLWLQCGGYHSYDKEHIGRIKYYPDPPGFDAGMFPLDAHKNSPLVAIQISDFTFGLSLAIECKLWYDTGPSTIDFMLYVAPGEKIAMNRVIA